MSEIQKDLLDDEAEDIIEGEEEMAQAPSWNLTSDGSRADV